MDGSHGHRKTVEKEKREEEEKGEERRDKRAKIKERSEGGKEAYLRMKCVINVSLGTCQTDIILFSTHSISTPVSYRSHLLTFTHSCSAFAFDCVVCINEVNTTPQQAPNFLHFQEPGTAQYSPASQPLCHYDMAVSSTCPQYMER